MRVSFLVYGVFYVVIEMVGQQLEDVGWPNLTPLDVASALVNALLFVVVCIALVVGSDLARQRWGPALVAWHQERLRAHAEAQAEVVWDDSPIGVASWRPEPIALPAGPSGGGTYATSTYESRATGQPFPEEPGPLL
ncbi:MAG TPA: hypothetical protein VK402_02760 [Blastococcus sp.]|nr:hypothetical protein [Blastococcus sp.]